MRKFYKLIAILKVPFYRQALLRQRVAAAVEHDALLLETGSGGHGGNAGQEQTAEELARVLVYLYRQLMD